MSRIIYCIGAEHKHDVPASIILRAGGGFSLRMYAVVGSNTAKVGRLASAAIPSSDIHSKWLTAKAPSSPASSAALIG